MSIVYKPTEPLEVGIGESMPAEFIKEAERSRARIVSFTDEIIRLKTENAKLREERDYYKALWDHATVTDCELRRVRAAWKEDREKNAKLRELARELWAYAEQELLCDENCPYGDTCDWMEPAVVCVFRRRMRELGVEVDG